ncbi:MAG: HDOD domain-containing protein [Lachnospiraceae bacterium]|nr:HDOD domain-containing protein [Lachnospiraceae bacterium]
MLATLIPLFDDKMVVNGYSIFAQRDNLLADPIKGATALYDGAMHIPGFEIIDSIGLGTLAEDRNIFMPVSNVSLFSDIAAQCSAPPEKIILLIDRHVTPDLKYTNRIHDLRTQGFKIAVWKLPLAEFGDYRAILNKADYVLLNHDKVNIQRAKAVFRQVYPHIQIVATNVGTQEDFEKLRSVGGFDLYEGNFFRMPVSKADTESSPLKATYIELLRVVNDPDFDLEDAADVISRDPALVISMLEMVNRMTVNSGISTVRHAAAMLGQKELKRWINTAVTKELCADKPSEITRMSLIRARFTENLAKSFQLAQLSSELFLTGLFSVLDVILDKPMPEALEEVKIAKPIADALLSGKGALAVVLDFVKQYENANWQSVSRTLLIKDLTMDEIYNAYLESLRWYRDLISPPKQ